MATGTAKTHAEEAAVLNDVVSRAHYVALLSLGGGESGPYSEPTYDGYMRMPVSWTSVTPQAPTSSQVANTGDLQWIITGGGFGGAGAIVRGLALYETATGGSPIRYLNFAAPITAFGFLKILAGTLTIVED